MCGVCGLKMINDPIFPDVFDEVAYEKVKRTHTKKNNKMRSRRKNMWCPREEATVKCKREFSHQVHSQIQAPAHTRHTHTNIQMLTSYIRQSTRTNTVRKYNIRPPLMRTINNMTSGIAITFDLNRYFSSFCRRQRTSRTRRFGLPWEPNWMNYENY